MSGRQPAGETQRFALATAAMVVLATVVLVCAGVSATASPVASAGPAQSAAAPTAKAPSAAAAPAQPAVDSISANAAEGDGTSAGSPPAPAPGTEPPPVNEKAAPDPSAAIEAPAEKPETFLPSLTGSTFDESDLSNDHPIDDHPDFEAQRSRTSWNLCWPVHTRHWH